MIVHPTLQSEDFLAFPVSLFLIYFVAWSLCRVMEGRFFLAVPNERSAHHHPTSQGGGAAIFLSFFFLVTAVYSYFFVKTVIDKGIIVFASPMTFLAPFLGMVKVMGEQYITAILFFLLASPLAIIGMIDDQRHISAFWRFLTHSVFGVSAVFLLQIHVPFTVIPCLNDVMIVILMIAFINACNFSDGINGMVSGTILLWLLYVTLFLGFPVVFLLLFGAILGFFMRNFPKGRIFLGDCGSTFLAGMILLMGFYPFSHSSHTHSLYSKFETITPHPLLQLLIIFAPFVFVFCDICLTLVMRVSKGHSPLTPHKEHFMQKLLHHHGWSHKNITLLYGVGAFTSAVTLGVGSVKGYFLLGLLVYLPLQMFFFFSILFFGKGRNKLFW